MADISRKRVEETDCFKTVHQPHLQGAAERQLKGVRYLIKNHSSLIISLRREEKEENNLLNEETMNAVKKSLCDILDLIIIITEMTSHCGRNDLTVWAK